MSVTVEQEEVLNEMSDDDYESMQRCPNCGEKSETWLDRLPTRSRGKSFVVMKCLSCGRYFSITKNWRKLHPKPDSIIWLEAQQSASTTAQQESEA